MMITVCDICRKEISGNPEQKDAVLPATIPIPTLPHQELYKDQITRVLLLKVYDSTRNDSELCLECALGLIANIHWPLNERE